MPLNDQLYRLLTQRLGRVTIANEGEAMVSHYSTHPFSHRTTLVIDVWGETYNIDCPFCNDTRRRLSINHHYGVYDLVTQSDNLTLARCFNEDCLKDPGAYQDLRMKVFGFLNLDQRRHLLVVRPGRLPVNQASALTQAPSPGVVHELTSLPENHPAREYLRQRGFDLNEICPLWRPVYCSQAASDYPTAQGRLIIPVIYNNVYVGWQARYVGERNWKPEGVPKYFAMPGFPRTLVLYNHDLARQQPVLVVCEGPTDVWRVGPAGVALLSKQASTKQVELIAEHWADKPVVVLLDGDAQVEGTWLCRQLEPRLKGGLVQVVLPDGRDPGSHDRSELWATIRDQATRQGILIPELESAQLSAIPE
jgi:hypothetical protein